MSRLQEIFSRGNSKFDAAKRLCQILAGAGGRALFVGGCVRDAFLGMEGKDYDLEVYGLDGPQIVQAIQPYFHFNEVGASFGVLNIAGYDIDLAMPRTESRIGASHRDFSISTNPNLSFRDAAARRDFTLNAILYDPLNEEIIDPWNGQADLQAGILRHVSEHFTEDPLRVLRAMQFVARFGFRVAPETIRICSELNQNFLPPERLAGEWEKLLLKSARPSLGLQFLRDCGWIRFYPELQTLIGCRQTPVWHPEGDVWNHTLLALDASAALRTGIHDDDLAFTLATLCHDFGKPLTTVFEEDGRITSKGHAEAGEMPTRSFFKRLYHRPDLEELVVKLVLNHMLQAFYGPEDPTDAAYRRLALRVQRIDLLSKVAKCDLLGITRNVDFSGFHRFQEHLQRLQIAQEAPKPILQGRHLIRLGVKPGPQMGIILNQCFEAQIEGEFQNLDEAILYYQAHFGKHD